MLAWSQVGYGRERGRGSDPFFNDALYAKGGNQADRIYRIIETPFAIYPCNGFAMTEQLAVGQQLTSGAALAASVAEAIESHGYVIVEQALPEHLLHDLLAHFQSLDAEAFNRAGIGRETDFQVNKFIRTDEIHWLEGSHPVTRAYFQWMEQLRVALNRRLFLGLFDYECHYAWYPEGAFYKTHFDTFRYDALRGSSTRVISSVLYLNPHWLPGDGGELVIYRPDQSGIVETVAPLFGRLVLFLSADFPHEVLPVKAARYSVTGWFRKNNSLGDSIDPPR